MVYRGYPGVTRGLPGGFWKFCVFFAGFRNPQNRDNGGPGFQNTSKKDPKVSPEGSEMGSWKQLASKK